MERISLQKYTDEDYCYFASIVMNNDIMTMNLGRVFTEAEAQEYYKYIVKYNSESNEGYGHFKVINNSTHTFIGSCALTINEEFTEGEIEYLLLPEYWRKGYGMEIASNLLGRTQQIKSIRTVTAITDPNNIGSKAILAKHGFKLIKTYKIEDGSLAQLYQKELVHK